jgi:triphosphatase
MAAYAVRHASFRSPDCLAMPEIELKLSIAPEGIAALKRHPLLAARRASTVNLHSAYFDTADLDLAGRGLTLRVRRQGRRHVQTVKSGSFGQIGLTSRGESEQAVASGEPEIAAIADEALRRQIAEIVGDRPLVRIFASEIRRTRWQLEDGAGGEVEVALDIGRLSTGTTEVPVSEVEIELKRGQAGDLVRIAQALGQAVPLRLDVASKSARGFALHRGREADVRKAEPVPLAEGATIAEAGLAILAECLSHIAANQAAVQAGRDSEGVHQMRVGVRRLRAALSLFGDLLDPGAREELTGELRWLAAALAPARAWDVFLTELLPPVARVLAGDAAMAPVEAAAMELREQGYAEARAAIGSQRYFALVLSLTLWLAEPPWISRVEADMPAETMAAEILDRRHRKVRRLARVAADLDETQLHALRLRFKKLRYAAEFLAPLFPDRPMKRYIKAISRPQKTLGNLNDAQTLKPLIDGLSAAGSNGARAVGAIAGFHAGRAEALLDQARSDIRSFAKAWRSWG